MDNKASDKKLEKEKDDFELSRPKYKMMMNLENGLSYPKEDMEKAQNEKGKKSHHNNPVHEKNNPRLKTKKQI